MKFQATYQHEDGREHVETFKAFSWEFALHKAKGKFETFSLQGIEKQ